jgi:ubiquinol-cytochrome c reductase iron-sulfur subunit
VTGHAVGLIVGVVVVLAGLGFAVLAKRLVPGEPDEEAREQKGPDRQRRQLILGAGAGVAALTATAVAFPAARRAGSAAERLRSTSWAEGRRFVDADGTLVRAADVGLGELVTVYPEGAVDAIDSQAVLIRESLARFVPDPERPDWVPDGLAAYSKLCTHMACPLGLYQQQSGTLLCPCHQAVFDLLDGGRAVQGPARRALPQLPIRIDADGHIVSRGDFSDAVGTGFWGRP